MHGLNLYAYSARYYESAVGRFTTVDPHAEKYYSISPYVYAANNPIKVTDPTGMDTTHVAYNSMDKQDYQIQVNLPGGEDVIVVDNELPEIDILGEQFERFEYMGLSYTGTASFLLGYSAQLNLGYIPSDGVFINLTGGFVFGIDFSHGISGVVGNYVGDAVPTAETLKGPAWALDGGAGGLTIGTSKDVVQSNPVEIGQTGSYKYDEKAGTNWNMRSIGYSVGSKTLFSGSVKRTYTTSPLYLHKTK